jgi:carbamoyltransferase
VTTTYILGISAYYHDSAACLIRDGDIVAAAQEERFTRHKHDASFPRHAINYCIQEAGIDPAMITSVVFYEKPFLKFERLLETYLAFAPNGFRSFVRAIPLWIKDKLFQKSQLLKEIKDTLGDNVDWHGKLLFSEHHLSHAASAFFPSPFESAAVLTLDGVGEWSTTSLALGQGKSLKVVKEIHFPHSLGLLYSAFTYYLGFKVNSGEYKVMGLAPYGTPVYADLIKKHLIGIADDGSFQLDMRYFNYATGTTMTNKRFEALLGGPVRKAESALTLRDMNLAASIQKVTEEVVILLAKSIAKQTGQRNLCLAGGVALNCVANGALVRERIFDNIWIQPAAGDAGGSLGAALAVWYAEHAKDRTVAPEGDAMKGSYLGPSFTNEEVESALIACGARYVKLDIESLTDQVATALANQKAVGWMQGRLEFGPRSLGARSIIADPRAPAMQKQLNLKVKYRESFRPFAPCVLRENVADWFEHTTDSPYMLMVAHVRQDKRLPLTDSQNNLSGLDKLTVARSTVPAITHVDYSARLQTVQEETNARFHSLIKKFKDKTGCPMLINTSFNVRGEPIVCTPTDAFKCFMGTELDVLVIEDFVLFKEHQSHELRNSYEGQYELD